MGWLHDLLHGESDHDSESIPVTPNPDHLVPPPLPDLGSQDPAAAHKRGYASKVCPKRSRWSRWNRRPTHKPSGLSVRPPFASTVWM